MIAVRLAKRAFILVATIFCTLLVLFILKIDKASYLKLDRQTAERNDVEVELDNQSSKIIEHFKVDLNMESGVKGCDKINGADPKSCLTAKDFYYQLTEDEFRQIPIAPFGSLISHSNSELASSRSNTSTTGLNRKSSVRYRYAYLKDLIKDYAARGSENVSLVTMQVTKNVYNFYRNATLFPLPKFYAKRTCDKFNSLLPSFPYALYHEPYCETQNISYTTKIAYVNAPVFYNPILVAIGGGATVNEYGSVINRDGSRMFAFISACRSEFNPGFDAPNEIGSLESRYRDPAVPHHNSIFVITQYWGENPYHGLVEDMPRLAIHLSELISQHPNIKIHVKTLSGFSLNYLALLGLDKERLVTGVCSADVVYLPETSLGCGLAGHYQIHVQQKELRKSISHHFENVDNKEATCLMIRRRGERRITNYEEVRSLFQSYFPNCQHHEFDDASLPSQLETAQLFYNSDVIVAPHGAGLGNMVIGKPNAILVEFLTHQINLCYTMLMSQLGVRYHGILPAESEHIGHITVDLDEFKEILEAIKQQR